MYSSTVIIGGENNAFFFVHAVRRIPDLFDWLIGPRNAAKDIVFFPEAFFRLKGGFVGFAPAGVSHGLFVVGREVVVDTGHQMRWDAIEAIVCFDLIFDPFVLIDHLDALVLEHHRCHHHVIEDLVGEFAQVAFDNLIHTANRLEQHWPCFTFVLAQRFTEERRFK